MTQYFVLITGDLSADQQRQLSEALVEPTGWWHQVPQGWVICDPDSIWSAQKLVEAIEKISPLAECAAFKVRKPSDWHVRLMPEKLKSTEEWMAKFWLRPSASP